VRRLDGTGVTANCLHPGGVRTNLGRGNSAVLDVVQRVLTLIMKSPEQGAQTSIWLASSPDVEGVCGRYYANCKEKQPAAWAKDPHIARRLWEISEELTGLRYP
jgi:NAD(P)-dependent dehydrogenase (short-subunit alcohol dehydrogenase family)